MFKSIINRIFSNPTFNKNSHNKKNKEYIDNICKLSLWHNFFLKYYFLFHLNIENCSINKFFGIIEKSMSSSSIQKLFITLPHGWSIFNSNVFFLRIDYYIMSLHFLCNSVKKIFFIIFNLFIWWYIGIIIWFSFCIMFFFLLILDCYVLNFLIENILILMSLEYIFDHKIDFEF